MRERSSLSSTPAVYCAVPVSSVVNNPLPCCLAIVFLRVYFLFEMASPIDVEDELSFVDIDRLLVLVQSYPPLYNPSLKEYHNQDVIAKIWADIAKELNVPGRPNNIYLHRFGNVYLNYFYINLHVLMTADFIGIDMVYTSFVLQSLKLV